MPIQLTFLCGRPVMDFLRRFHIWHWLGILVQLVRIELWYRHHRLWKAPFWLDITVHRKARHIHVWLRRDPDWEKFKKAETKPWERLAAGFGDMPEGESPTLLPLIPAKAGTPCQGSELTEASHPLAPP